MKINIFLLAFYVIFLQGFILAQDTLLRDLLYFPSTLSSSYFYDTSSCSAYKSLAPGIFFNRVTLKEEYISQTEVEGVKDFFGEIAHSWWIPSYCAQVQDILRSNKYTYIQANRKMICDLSSLNFNTAEYNTLCNISMLDQSSLTDQEIWTTTVANGFNCSQESIALFFKYLINIYGLNRLYLYIVYADTVPVSSALVITHKEHITVHLCSTLRAYRGRGYATHLLKKICADAQENNYKYTALLASEKGESIYKKCGFKEYDLYYVFG